METSVIKYIVGSFRIVNQNILLVVAPSFLYVLMRKFPNNLIALPVIVFAILVPIIYARFFEIATGVPRSHYTDLLRKYWGRYFLAGLILIFPLFVLMFVLDFIPSGVPAFITNNIIGLAMGSISIYVFPLVFMLKSALRAVLQGIRCTLSNLEYSLPIIFLVILQRVINILFQLYGSRRLEGDMTTWIVEFFALAITFLSYYIAIVIFVTAVLVLKFEPRFESCGGVEPT